MKNLSNLVRRDQLLDLSDGDVCAGHAEQLRDPDLEHGEGHQESRHSERTLDKLHLSHGKINLCIIASCCEEYSPVCWLLAAQNTLL